MTRSTFALLGLLCAGALAGCSGSFSIGGGVDMDEIADEARAQLSALSAEHGGDAFPEVTCPGDLDEEVGSVTDCYASFDGEKHEIRVEVTGVDGSHLDLDFQTDALPSVGGSDQPPT